MGNLIVLSMPRSKSNKVTKSISVPQPIADRVIELAPDSEAELYVELIQRGLRMYEGERVKSLELDLRRLDIEIKQLEIQKLKQL